MGATAGRSARGEGWLAFGEGGKRELTVKEHDRLRECTTGDRQRPVLVMPGCKWCVPFRPCCRIARSWIVGMDGQARKCQHGTSRPRLWSGRSPERVNALERVQVRHLEEPSLERFLGRVHRM